MPGKGIKLTVDTSEIDRVAIGCRLYDAFSGSNTINKIQYDDGVAYMTEKDINDMYKLVNPNRIVNDIVVYRP